MCLSGVLKATTSDTRVSGTSGGMQVRLQRRLLPLLFPVKMLQVRIES